jgi:hypothetical protein|tara:strand:+ start:1082 stop:1243 length:162 start_codon:yes stop_codon:yes gene_type:complete
METFNTFKDFLSQEWTKTVEYQAQSWTDAKIQLATNQEQVTELFNKVVAPFVN